MDGTTIFLLVWMYLMTGICSYNYYRGLYGKAAWARVLLWPWDLVVFLYFLIFKSGKNNNNE